MVLGRTERLETGWHFCLDYNSSFKFGGKDVRYKKRVNYVRDHG